MSTPLDPRNVVVGAPLSAHGHQWLLGLRQDVDALSALVGDGDDGPTLGTLAFKNEVARADLAADFGRLWRKRTTYTNTATTALTTLSVAVNAAVTTREGLSVWDVTYAPEAERAVLVASYRVLLGDPSNFTAVGLTYVGASDVPVYYAPASGGFGRTAPNRVWLFVEGQTVLTDVTAPVRIEVRAARITGTATLNEIGGDKLFGADHSVLTIDEYEVI